MQKSESIKELASALTKAQGEMPAVKFNATNPFLKNKYADLGAIIAASKPILAKHGLAVSQLSTSDDNRIGVETVLMHQSGEYIASSLSMEIADEKGKSSAQVAGSIITYLRRYALASILGMYADEDGDGNEPESPNRKRTAMPRQSAKPEAPLTPADLSAAVQDTRQANGDKWARPMKPEVLKEALEKKYAVSKPATEKQMTTARILLINYFGAREDERHQATAYLTGHKSTKDVTPQQWRALMDWMNPTENPDGSGDYIMGKDAQAELSMVAGQYMADRGQASLL